MSYLIKSIKAIVSMILISLVFDVTAADDVPSETKTGLNLTDEQAKKSTLREKVITGNSLSTNNVNYLTSEIKVRLNLTDEQTKQFVPIFLKHIENRLGALEKHGFNPYSLSYGKKMGFHQLRAIKKDMDKINKQAENQLSGVLNKEQIDEYKKMQEEQRIEMRARLKNGDTRKE